MVATMSKALFAAFAGKQLFMAQALNVRDTPDAPKCGLGTYADIGEVVATTDGTYDRCFSLITPTSVSKPMPVLFWFHGSGGNAASCNNKMAQLGEQYGFALICGEALQGIFGNGGHWDLPYKMTDETGTPCDGGDSLEVTYMQNIVAHLAKSPGRYDTSRLFTSGCSMGSAFSGYISNCLKDWDSKQISAFAMHSSGLKQKGDGITIHYSKWCEECDDVQWFPFVPKRYSDSVGLKACIYDNTGDVEAYKAGQQLAAKWGELGNPYEATFPEGGHCQNIPHSDIVACLGLGGSPTPTPSPEPTPTPSPTPSPAPDEPPAACQQCFIEGCPELQGTGGQECTDCVKELHSRQACSSSCVPYPFAEAKKWFCGTTGTSSVQV